MSAKHTPGPWLREGCFVYALHIWRGRAVNRFSAAISGYTSQGGTEDEALANARLIAAAPDMLEIVARCEMWLATVPEGRAMQIACQAAIAKATGKELA